MSDYSIHVPPTDLSVALDCEAARAESERFPNVAQRQRALALHIRNATAHMQTFTPDGHRLQVNLVFTYVPNVNPVLRDEYR